MIILKKAKDLQIHLTICRQKNQTIGFVPTMGALHDGHLSLLKNSVAENQVTVCSIFVNPAQFNDPDDFKKYPSSPEADIFKLETNGCDVLFLPQLTEIYPGGVDKKQHYDLGYLETIMEGEFRPGHFQGVCMAVERLVRLAEPDKLYLGQKDYQQCLVIKKLIQMMGLEEKIQVRICPILREPDGLAMSSRNTRLNKEQRAKAPAIYETLLFVKLNFGKVPLQDLKEKAVALLQQKGFKTDYIEVADAHTLKPVTERDSRSDVFGLAACSIDDVRLIDNLKLS